MGRKFLLKSLMAVGKVNKRGGIKVKVSKRQIDAFTRKEWVPVVAPSFATNKVFCKITSNKDSAAKFAADSLKRRNVQINLSKLMDNVQYNNRMMKLRVQDVIGKYCVTTFDSCFYTAYRQFPQKRATLIEAFTDVKTRDGFKIRVKVCGTTGKQFKQLKANCYASNAQQRAIREMMKKVLHDALSKEELNGCVKLMIDETLENQIIALSRRIYSLANCKIFKMKVVSTPVMDSLALLQHHNGTEAFKSTLANITPLTAELVEEINQAGIEA